MEEVKLTEMTATFAFIKVEVQSLSLSVVKLFARYEIKAGTGTTIIKFLLESIWRPKILYFHVIFSLIVSDVIRSSEEITQRGWRANSQSITTMLTNIKLSNFIAPGIRFKLLVFIELCDQWVAYFRKPVSEQCCQSFTRLILLQLFFVGALFSKPLHAQLFGLNNLKFAWLHNCYNLHIKPLTPTCYNDCWLPIEVPIHVEAYKLRLIYYSFPP